MTNLVDGLCPHSRGSRPTPQGRGQDTGRPRSRATAAVPPSGEQPAHPADCSSACRNAGRRRAAARPRPRRRRRGASTPRGCRRGRRRRCPPPRSRRRRAAAGAPPRTGTRCPPAAAAGSGPSATKTSSPSRAPRPAPGAARPARPALSDVVQRTPRHQAASNDAVGERQLLRDRDHRRQAEQPAAGAHRRRHRLGADRPQPALGGQPARRTAHARAGVEQPGARSQVEPVGQPAQRALAAAAPASGRDRVLRARARAPPPRSSRRRCRTPPPSPRSRAGHARPLSRSGHLGLDLRAVVLTAARPQPGQVDPHHAGHRQQRPRLVDRRVDAGLARVRRGEHPLDDGVVQVQAGEALQHARRRARRCRRRRRRRTGASRRRPGPRRRRRPPAPGCARG